jgi:hypothetical protein
VHFESVVWHPACQRFSSGRCWCKREVKRRENEERGRKEKVGKGREQKEEAEQGQ